MENVKFVIEGMTCSSCVEKITEAFKQVEGVRAVEINLQTKEAKFESGFLMWLSESLAR